MYTSSSSSRTSEDIKVDRCRRDKLAHTFKIHYFSIVGNLFRVNMFSALAPILRKAIVARQPVFSSSLGFAARAYAVSASTSQVQPERVVSNWENPIGDYAVKTETFTRDLDEIWRTKSKAAVLEAARHPPANPYAGEYSCADTHTYLI